MELKLINAYKFKSSKYNIICRLRNINYHFTSKKLYIVNCKDDSKIAFMNALSLMEKIDNGFLFFNDIETTKLNDIKLARIRNQKIGIITENYNMDPEITILENLIIASILNKNIPFNQRKTKSLEILDYFNLRSKAHCLLRQLSNFDKQLIYLLRALVNNPDLIIIEEPTLHLSTRKEEKYFNLLKKIVEKEKCIIVFTSQNELSKYADETLELTQGKLLI